MKAVSRFLIAGGCWLGVLTVNPLRAAETRITFNEHIRPILSDNCFACHGTDANHLKGDRRLDLAEDALRDRNGIRAFVPGNLEESDAWQRILSEEDDERMPPADSHKPPLTAEQKQLIKTWIEQGAVYQNHWAYEPVIAPEVPAPSGGAKDHPIDRFIGAKLAAHHRSLAPEASPEMLLRRVTLALTGLPPTPSELDAFLADRAPGAYERAVDRLLSSSAFGEHLARGWLDAVRYADTHGLHYDNARTIWPYRDWVVQAFNSNQRFDQFTIEQLAGDLLPQPTQSQLVATGYLRSHLTTNEGGAIVEEVQMLYTNDLVDITTAVWLGLTANCASCHDHKFDPLKQSEYYSLGAFFKGLADKTWDANARISGPFIALANDEQQRRLDRAKAALPPLRKTLTTKAESLLRESPFPTSGPATYEVVWAEDGDVPLPQHFADSPPPAPSGEWRSGPTVPVAGGTHSLRLEETTDRLVVFASGDIPLLARDGTRVFAHVNLDPWCPPRAVSLEVVTDKGQVQRMVWGDSKAWGEKTLENAILAGPLPLPGRYVRLEVDTLAAGVPSDAVITGVRLAQSGGIAWWDRMGTVCTTLDAARDPLLSAKAWIRYYTNDARRDAAAIPMDVRWRLRLPDYFQDEEDRKIMGDYFRDFVYGPLRGSLEKESHAARVPLAEQIHFEQTLPLTLIAQELETPLPAHILIRGQYDNLGEEVQPTTPAFLPSLHQEKPGRPSRLDLARWIVSGDNPLTARVVVNRFWQHLFGEGLVRTPSDFGAQGAPPSHLELHNWLAAEFVRSGWDVKALLRLLVTSHAYRQSSVVSPDLLELDPQNKLLARGPRFRLDAEVLRDQALALSGLLVPTLGGAPVYPYQPENIWEPVAINDSNTRFYPQDKGEKLYRRSLYTFWKRTAPPPALSTFDAPSRESFCIQRARSDTPLQALALMNDVQQFEAARAFAERLLTRVPGSDEQRLVTAFRWVTSRYPDTQERAALREALAAQKSHFSAHSAAAAQVLKNGQSPASAQLPVSEFAAWTLVSSLLLNLDETLTPP